MVQKEFRLWAMNESGTSTSLNVTAVTRYHASNRYRWEGLSPFVPLSRLFTFTRVALRSKSSAIYTYWTMLLRVGTSRQSGSLS